MLKTLIAALLAASVTVVGFVGVAQAHHKTGHCFPPGSVVPGCPLKPQTPQVP